LCKSRELYRKGYPVAAIGCCNNGTIRLLGDRVKGKYQ